VAISPVSALAFDSVAALSLVLSQVTAYSLSFLFCKESCVCVSSPNTFSTNNWVFIVLGVNIIH
jgi:hypothetical protein